MFRLRESSRDELFEKAKGEILDEVVNLSQISAKDWENLLYIKLWEKLSSYCFENIYLAAANASSPGILIIFYLSTISTVVDYIEFHSIIRSIQHDGRYQASPMG